MEKLDNNNNERKIKKSELPPIRTTRSRRMKKLINPIVYFDCHLCGRSDYQEKTTREHYKNKHNLDLGQAPLPKSIKDLIHKCSICGLIFRLKQELEVHKSIAHVDQR